MVVDRGLRFLNPTGLLSRQNSAIIKCNPALLPIQAVDRAIEKLNTLKQRQEFWLDIYVNLSRVILIFIVARLIVGNHILPEWLMFLYSEFGLALTFNALHNSVRDARLVWHWALDKRALRYQQDVILPQLLHSLSMTAELKRSTNLAESYYVIYVNAVMLTNTKKSRVLKEARRILVAHGLPVIEAYDGQLILSADFSLSMSQAVQINTQLVHAIARAEAIKAHHNQLLQQIRSAAGVNIDNRMEKVSYYDAHHLEQIRYIIDLQGMDASYFPKILANLSALFGERIMLLEGKSDILVLEGYQASEVRLPPSPEQSAKSVTTTHYYEHHEYQVVGHNNLYKLPKRTTDRTTIEKNRPVVSSQSQVLNIHWHRYGFYRSDAAECQIKPLWSRHLPDNKFFVLFNCQREEFATEAQYNNFCHAIQDGRVARAKGANGIVHTKDPRSVAPWKLKVKDEDGRVFVGAVENDGGGNILYVFNNYVPHTH